MGFLHAIILGAVEGFTEFLPISSTAHLIIISRLLGLEETAFLKSFTISIQLGAILAVVFFYSRRLFTDWETNKRLAVAFLPTAGIGFLLYKLIKNYLLSNFELALFMLFIGGAFLILFERLHKEKEGTENNISTIS